MTRTKQFQRAAALAVFVALFANSARSDDRPTAAARAEAARQFELGSKAFDGGDFRSAGDAFESAFRIAPHVDSLWNAGRAWQRAGELGRAANLFFKYLRIAPPGAPDRDEATSQLRLLSAKLGRIEVHGEALDEIAVDEDAVDARTHYVRPGSHVVRGRVGGKVVRVPVDVDAGGTISVALEAPVAKPDPLALPPPSAPLPASSPLASAPAPAPPTSGRQGLPPAVVWVGSAVTAIAIGLTVWSGADTLGALNRFDAASTQKNLDDGRARQARTNVLLAVAAGTGGLTAAAAIWLVDWRGPGRAHISMGLSGKGLALRTTFE